MLFYAKSPHSWALPSEWQKICDKFPAIIRNKVTTTSTTTHVSTVTTTSSINSTTTLPSITNPSYSSNTLTKASSLTLRVACNNAAPSTSCIQNMATATTSNFFYTTNTNTITTTNSSLIKTLNSNSNLASITHSNIPTTTTSSSINNAINISSCNSNNNSNNNNLNYTFNNQNNNNNYYNQAYYNDTNNINSNKLQESSNNSLAYKLNSHASLSLNIRRKGFFNRLTYSIDEDGYEASMKTPSPVVELPPQTSICNTTTIHHTHITPNANMSNVTAGSGRIHSAGLNRHIASVRSGPMSAVPLTSVTNTDYLPNEAAHTRQKLLHKQIKIISDIMVESSKNGSAHKSNENLKSLSDNVNQKTPSFGDNNGTGGTAIDNDDDIEIVAVSTATATAEADAENVKSSSHSTNVRPKLSYDFRSYSTCD